MNKQSLFWSDLASDLKDREVLDEFILESLRIQAIDEIINTLDAARELADVSKANIARAIDANPAAVRRLFTNTGNPTLGTISDVAAVLGFKLSLVPLVESDIKPAKSRKKSSKNSRLITA